NWCRARGSCAPCWRIVGKADREPSLSPAALSQFCRSRHRESAICNSDICYLFCMKTAWYGRMAFGASAVLFRGLPLIWHDAETWQNLMHLWSLPFGTIIGGCLMIGQIAGGIGIQSPRITRLATLVLCVVYFCFSLACIPDIIAASNVYDRYGGSFFVFFS